jgi:hypothetical protein
VKGLPALVKYSPTAVQSRAAVHDTPFKSAVAPARLGVGWISQLTPFQCSANVTWAPLLVEWIPTAVQSRAAVHETPNKRLKLAPAGAGVGWISQVAPFQRSTSVNAVPAAVK